MIEILVNEYWMYENEPFHIIRKKEGELFFICGYNGENSLAIQKICEGGIYQYKDLRSLVRPKHRVPIQEEI